MTAKTIRSNALQGRLNRFGIATWLLVTYLGTQTGPYYSSEERHRLSPWLPEFWKSAASVLDITEWSAALE